MELRVVYDTLHLLRNGLHIFQQLVDVVHDLHLGRRVAQTLVRVAIEANDGLQSVLAVLSIHFVED